MARSEAERDQIIMGLLGDIVFSEVRDDELVVISPDTSKMKEYWNLPDIVENWSHEEGGMPASDRSLVRDALEDSQFYSGLSSKSFLLDIGVGAQSYLNPSLLPQQSRVCAVDLSEGMLNNLMNTDSDPSIYDAFVTSRVTALPFQNDTFDGELTTFMMRYLSKEDQIRAISEMVRTSKPESEIHVIDYNMVHFPYQVSTFNPDLVQASIQSSAFQTGLEKMGKRIESVTSKEIPLTSPSSGLSTRLFHMTLHVGR